MSAQVMHATDFSSASRPAFAKAVQLARRDRTGLVSVHVMTPPAWGGDGYIAPSTIDEGIPAEQILRAAKTLRPGLIAVGTHGRTGIARFFVGSVASRVGAGSTSPVVTVRGK